MITKQDILENQDHYIATYYNTELPPGYYIGDVHPDHTTGETEIDVFDDEGEFYDSFAIPHLVSLQEHHQRRRAHEATQWGAA